MKFWFWFLWAIDGVIAAVALYFFFSCLPEAESDHSTFCRGWSFLPLSQLWLEAAFGCARAGQHALDIVLLLLLAILGALFVVLFVLVLIIHPDFR